jgi:glucosamine kinase
MNVPPALFIGIDGGGSRCRARIRDSTGRALSEAEGGPSNIYQDLPSALATIVATAAKAAESA